jgi:hypothetical protein
LTAGASPKIGDQGHIHVGGAHEHHKSDLKNASDRARQRYFARLGARRADQIGEREVG